MSEQHKAKVTVDIKTVSTLTAAERPTGKCLEQHETECKNKNILAKLFYPVMLVPESHSQPHLHPERGGEASTVRWFGDTGY